MSEVKIEIAKAEDAEDIANIAYQVAKMHDDTMPDYFKPVPQGEQLNNIKEMLSDERIVVFKAIVEKKICGFLFLEMIHRASSGLAFSKLGSILNVGVDESCQNRGIGTALLQGTEKYVKAQGGEAVDLCVFAFNQRAIELYKRQGYQIIDVSMRKILK